MTGGEGIHLFMRGNSVCQISQKFSGHVAFDPCALDQNFDPAVFLGRDDADNFRTDKLAKHRICGGGAGADIDA